MGSRNRDAKIISQGPDKKLHFQVIASSNAAGCIHDDTEVDCFTAGCEEF